MKYFYLMLLLVLASCAGIPAQDARTRLIGMTLPDIISCAGKPDKIMAVTHDDIVLQYDQDTPVQPNFNIGGSNGFSLGIGSIGACHAMIRIHKGYLGSIHYTGQNWTFGGYLSACSPLIKSCYSRIDHTQIDSNYNSFKILGIEQP